MGLFEWIKSFSLPKTEEECNALLTDDTDPKPVQWDSTASKCKFFVPTDEALLGMAKCSAEQMFDMSNNTCSAKRVDIPVESSDDSIDDDIEGFTNVHKLPVREQKHLFILLVLVVLMYVYRKQLKQALHKAKIYK